MINRQTNKQTKRQTNRGDCPNVGNYIPLLPKNSKKLMDTFYTNSHQSHPYMKHFHGFQKAIPRQLLVEENKSFSNENHRFPKYPCSQIFREQFHFRELVIKKIHISEILRYAEFFRVFYKVITHS